MFGTLIGKGNAFPRIRCCLRKAGRTAIGYLKSASLADGSAMRAQDRSRLSPALACDSEDVRGNGHKARLPTFTVPAHHPASFAKWFAKGNMSARQGRQGTSLSQSLVIGTAGLPELSCVRRSGPKALIARDPLGIW